VLDFYRFSSDVQVAFHRAQAEVIRRNSPGRPITHNLMGLFHHIDYFKLAAELDIVAWDNYPFAANGTNRPPSPLPHDLMRGLKQKNVWVMEQGSGPGGWGSFAATPQPGQMRLWAYQAVARGADMISFFRWRSCRWGREQYWHGILYHHGIPQRRYDEAKQLGAEFKALSAELDGSEVAAEVGILYDYDSLWALETQPNAGDGFDYRQMAAGWDAALGRLGVVADAVSKGAEILEQFPEETRAEIALRIARIGPVEDEVVRELDEVFRKDLSSLGGPARQLDGVEKLAAILNQLEGKAEEAILASIETEDNDLAETIRKRMFVFEDLLQVNDKGFREILQNEDLRRFIL
jgi:hypothetical protein